MVSEEEHDWNFFVCQKIDLTHNKWYALKLWL